jgi:DNA modification methylase
MYDRRAWVKDAAWENSRWHSLSYKSVDEFEYLYIFWKPGVTKVDRTRLTNEEWRDWGSRAVWYIPSVRANDDHEAKFPLELPLRFIQLLTEPDEVVLDCFMGSGTTAMAAIRQGRRFVGIELIEEYVELAQTNIQKTMITQQRQLELPVDNNGNGEICSSTRNNLQMTLID